MVVGSDNGNGNGSDNRKWVLCLILSFVGNTPLYQHHMVIFLVMQSAGGSPSAERPPAFAKRVLVEVMSASIVADGKAQSYDRTARPFLRDFEVCDPMDRAVDVGRYRLPVLPSAEGVPLPPTIPVQAYAASIPDSAPLRDTTLYSYFIDGALHNPQTTKSAIPHTSSQRPPLSLAWFEYECGVWLRFSGLVLPVLSYWFGPDIDAAAEAARQPGSRNNLTRS